MAWNWRSSAGILAPMEVMFHDMERTLGRSIRLPTPTTEDHRTFKDQIIIDRVGMDAEEGDEAVDMAYQSAEISPQVDTCKSFGAQFLNEQTPTTPNPGQETPDLSREFSIDSSASGYYSDAGTLDPDRHGGMSLSSTSSPVPISPPPLPLRTLGERRLDDFAERWTQSQIARQNMENDSRNGGHCIPRKPVQSGLRAQC